MIPAVPAQPSATKKRALSDPFSRVPLYGCAYRGAIDLAVHIKDAAILGHAPKAAPGMPLTVLPATDEEDCMNAESFTRPLFQDSLRILISP